jgi:hypothetical protein
VDGRDCLEKVVEADPDVITLDVMMPRLDGWVTGDRGEEDDYPAFWYSPDGPRQAVKVFYSVELSGLWDHLDWFEGPNWPRRVVPVELADGRTVEANLYERVGQPPHQDRPDAPAGPPNKSA